MKKTITAAVAVAALAFGAAPASAQDLIQHTLDTSADGWHVVESDRSIVAIACTAIAGPNAIETRLTECFLKGDNGARYEVPVGANTSNWTTFAPGPAAAFAGETLHVPVQGYHVCVSAFARYADGATLTEPVRCSRPYRFN